MKMISYSVATSTSIKTVNLFTAICTTVDYFRSHGPIVSVQFDPQFLRITAAAHEDGLTFQNNGRYDFQATWRFVATLIRWMGGMVNDEITFTAQSSTMIPMHTKHAIYVALGMEREWNMQRAKKFKKASELFNWLYPLAVRRRKAPPLATSLNTASVDSGWDTISFEHEADQGFSELLTAAEHVEQQLQHAQEEADFESAWDLLFNAQQTSATVQLATPPRPPSIPPSTDHVNTGWDEAPASTQQPAAAARSIIPSSTDDIDANWGDRPSQAA